MEADKPSRHNWFLRRCHPLVLALVWPLLFILGPVRVIGRYRVPKSGGLLILCNHVADVDPVVVWYACTRPIHFMAKSELFGVKVLGAVMRFFRAFPVRRGEPDRQSIKYAVALLKEGEAVCIFPEGQLSETGALQPILPGAGLIARMAGVAVICGGIRGTNRIIPYGSLIPRPALGGVSVTWGEPRVFSKEDEIEDIVAWAESQLRNLLAD